MTRFSYFFRCAFGPKLFALYAKNQGKGQTYQPLISETIANYVITTIRFCWSFSVWTSPVLLMLAYRKNFFNPSGVVMITEKVLVVFLTYCAAIMLRGIGRLRNSDYKNFLSLLEAARQTPTKQLRGELSKFDFERTFCPIDFFWDEVVSGADPLRFEGHSQPKFYSHVLNKPIGAIPLNFLCYAASCTFGRRMVYPGTTAFIHSMVNHILVDARLKCVCEKQGQRLLLQSSNGDIIDTMFLDRRGDKHIDDDGKGEFLVICCEGNAGFYEIGCAATSPQDLGYSVLGWNHPGFGGSSGVPWPDSEHRAIDVVLQYAIHQLKFPLEKILIFAWSIGGYPAAWLCKNYPSIGGLILDASFDHVLPLALNQMPVILDPLTRRAIRQYFNLNVGELLESYHGPVRFIRRLRDEVLTLRPGNVSSNCCNSLVLHHLRTRYSIFCSKKSLDVIKTLLENPNVKKFVYEDYGLRDWRKPSLDISPFDANTTSRLPIGANPGTSAFIMRELEREISIPLIPPDYVCNLRCETILKNFNENPSTLNLDDYLENGESLERLKTQVLLFITDKILDDFNETHCKPLPKTMFRRPWVAGEDNSHAGYVNS